MAVSSAATAADPLSWEQTHPHVKMAERFLQGVLPRLAAYSEEGKGEIHQATLACLQLFPGLALRVKEFGADGSNYGVDICLVCLEGTVPATVLGAVYNIPISVRLAAGYPLRPPALYVTPSKGMVLNQNHNALDKTGKCSLGGLTDMGWKGERRSLVRAIQEMIGAFAEDSPVYASVEEDEAQEATAGTGSSTPEGKGEAESMSPQSVLDYHREQGSESLQRNLSTRQTTV